MDQILMQWRRRSDDKLVLFVKDGLEKPFVPYTLSKFYEPDYKVPFFGSNPPKPSMGFRTAQNVLKRGGKYLPIDESLRVEVFLEDEAV